MSDHNLYFEADIETLSPLHIGTGEVTADDQIKNDEGRLVTIAAICRDHENNPYIPPTSLKGIIKRQLQDIKLIEKLFGTISHKDDETGQMGSLILYGAEFKSTDTQSALPKAENGVFISARTKIDEITGTADDSKLFYQEMCVPHTKFKLRARLTDPAQKDTVLRLLAALAQETGLASGKGQADGQGRIKLLTDTVTLKTTRINDGELTSSTTKCDLSDSLKDLTSVQTFKLRLSCQGPFIISDWSDKESEKQQGDEKARKNLTKAQRHKNTTPELPGTSLMGALRARAQWLNHPDLDGDETVVPSLFGETGRAAILRLDHIKCVNEPTIFTHTSVKIDRFSGATIDSALATTQAFVDPVFEATFSLAPRRFKPKDETAQQRLFADLVENGIMLGHSTNSGFGWFNVEEVV